MPMWYYAAYMPNDLINKCPLLMANIVDRCSFSLVALQSRRTIPNIFFFFKRNAKMLTKGETMMKRIVALKRYAVLLVLIVGLSWTTPAVSAELDLPDLPLFLNINVLPNILLLIDNTKTMDYEIMTTNRNSGLFTNTQPDGTDPGDAGAVKHRDDDDDGIADCDFKTNFDSYTYTTSFAGNTVASAGGKHCNVADDQEWRFRNSDFNILYFDPNKTYKPWAGLDPNGVPWPNASITAAKDNPANPVSKVRDLTTLNSGGTTSDRDGDLVPDGFRYYTWNDLDGDGNFDNGEETEFLIKDQDAATQQNFANWFQYHRRRAWVTKAVYGDLIAELQGIQIGFKLFNNKGGGESPVTLLPVQDVTTDPKLTLLDNLYNYGLTSNDKDTRKALEDAGEYLACTQANHPLGCPALDADKGGICQQNFTLLMADGPYVDNSPVSVGNTDGDNNTKFDGGAYGDPWSETLADIAMKYYENDLRPGVADEVPTVPGVDEASHQHMVNFVISFGAKGHMTDMPADPAANVNWQNPIASPKAKVDADADKIDDMRHAAYNSRGVFLNANNPEELLKSLKEALNVVADRTSSAASVALNSGSQNINSRVYQARFSSGDWSGQLLSFPLNPDGTIAAAEWDSGIELDKQDWDSGRNIYSYRADLRKGVPFRWSKLSTPADEVPSQQDYLNADSDGVVDSEGPSRLNYLRGSKADEGKGNNYRLRKTNLGDLINSDPFYVGKIPMAFEAVRSKAMVYVGGNDGMLHGFNALTGKEEMAYVPNSVFKRLSFLTADPYKHRFFVDASPTAAPVEVGGAWKLVLVSGLRSGGQGVFALDVTSTDFNETDTEAAQRVLWEFTDADDPDLGYTFSQPSIVKIKTTAGPRWVALMGNGYNNTEADGNASVDGHAALFLLFLDSSWAAGPDYLKLQPNAPVGTVATPNALATPAAVDINGDGTTDYIYSGDLRGNIWRFDVRSLDPALPPSGVKVFSTLTDGIGIEQPITSRPQVGEHPSPDPNDRFNAGTIIYFGTGKYAEVLDPQDTTQQTYYAFYDEGAPLSIANASTVVASKGLEQQTISVVSGQRIISNNPVDLTLGANTKSGWFLNLPDSGERVVSNPLLRNERIIFTTLIPNVAICGFGGTSWLMEVDAFTGGSLEESPFDLNDDGVFDDNDMVDYTDPSSGETKKVAVAGIPSSEGILPTPTVLAAGDTEIKFNSGSRGGIQVTVENPGPNAAGRIAWRQY